MDRTIITPQMVEAFKSPTTLFIRKDNNQPFAPSNANVSSSGPDQHMVDQESTVCDVSEVEKKAT